MIVDWTIICHVRLPVVDDSAKQRLATPYKPQRNHIPTTTTATILANHPHQKPNHMPNFQPTNANFPLVMRVVG